MFALYIILTRQVRLFRRPVSLLQFHHYLLLQYYESKQGIQAGRQHSGIFVVVYDNTHVKVFVSRTFIYLLLFFFRFASFYKEKL